MLMTKNPKISWFAPVEFAPFMGMSYLFINPGQTHDDSKRQQLCCRLSDDRHTFYRVLSRAFLEHIGVIRLMERFHFCPLQAKTYHVTVADLVNISNIDTIRQPFQQKFQAILDSLPASLTGTSLQNLPAPPNGWSSLGNEIRFRFKGLVLDRKFASLAAALIPANPKSEAAFAELKAYGVRVNEHFDRMGRPPSPDWTPHVTLGYLPKSDYFLDAAERELPRWDQQIRDEIVDNGSSSTMKFARIADETICFEQVALYSFTDMEHFYLVNSLEFCFVMGA